MNEINAVRSTPPFRSVHVAHNPRCPTNSAQRPFYQCKPCTPKGGTRGPRAPTDRKVVCTSSRCIAPYAHFDAIASDLARTGVLSGHLDAWHAACARVRGEFTLVSRSFHSIYVGPTVNGMWIGVNEVNAVRSTPPFRSVHVAHHPTRPKSSAQRPFYQCKPRMLNGAMRGRLHC